MSKFYDIVSSNNDTPVWVLCDEQFLSGSVFFAPLYLAGRVTRQRKWQST